MKETGRNIQPTTALTFVVVAAIALTAATAGCTESQPQFDLKDVIVYISTADESGWVVVVPFYDLTHEGPQAGNLSFQITMSGSDPLSMNGYNIQPVFIDGLYQPALNMGLNAIDGEDATLRFRLTWDEGLLFDESYVVQIDNLPKLTWVSIAAVP